MKRWLGLWHPSKQRLHTWLLTGEPDGVGVHVERCERCAERLEALDETEPVFDVDRPSPLRQALTSMFAPPDDLGDRVVEQVTRRSRGGDELALLAGLFSIGVETAQLMLEPDGGQDRVADPAEPTRPSGTTDPPEEDLT